MGSKKFPGDRKKSEVREEECRVYITFLFMYAHTLKILFSLIFLRRQQLLERSKSFAVSSVHSSSVLVQEKQWLHKGMERSQKQGDAQARSFVSTVQLGFTCI